MLKPEMFFSRENASRVERYAYNRNSVFDPWFPLTPEGEAHELVAAVFEGWICMEKLDMAEEKAAQQQPSPLLVSMHFTKPYPRNEDEGPHDHPELVRPGHIDLYGGHHRKFDPSSHLRPPLYVGKECAIRLAAKVIGPSIIGDRVMIGSSTFVTRSVIGADSEIDDGGKIKDALVGREVYIGPDAKLLNKLDRSFTPIEIPDHRADPPRNIKTGRVRFGAVVGDACNIGAGAILYPGVVLFPGCCVLPGEIVPAGVYTPEILAHRRSSMHVVRANGHGHIPRRATVDVFESS